MTFATSALRCALVLLAARTAAADPIDDAFKRGRELYKAGKFAESCALFHEIEQTTPSLGVSFNIAQCDEKIGKLASALAIYRELAAKDTNATRKAASADLATKLAPRVPQIEIHVEPHAAHLVVTLAGKALPCTAQCATTPVDFGTYAIVAKAPGYRDATASITVDAEGRVIVVPLRLEPVPLVPSATNTGSGAGNGTNTANTAIGGGAAGGLVAGSGTTSRGSSRKTIATVAMIGGGVALAGGIVAGFFARTAWNDAKAICGGSTACPTDDETMRATALGDDAHQRATISTALVIGGTAILATGVVLYLTAPTDERAIAITARPTDVTLSVRF